MSCDHPACSQKLQQRLHGQLQPFMIFCAERREAGSSDTSSPESPDQIGKTWVEEWEALDDEKRSSYTDKSFRFDAWR